MWTVSAGEALNFGGTLIGFYPIKVLPSKTAILPVNPTFLPRVQKTLAISVVTFQCFPNMLSSSRVKLSFYIYTNVDPCDFGWFSAIYSLRMNERCVRGRSTVQTLIRRYKPFHLSPVMAFVLPVIYFMIASSFFVKWLALVGAWSSSRL